MQPNNIETIVARKIMSGCMITCVKATFTKTPKEDQKLYWNEYWIFIIRKYIFAGPTTEAGPNM